MQIQISQTQCNTCKSVIPSSGQNGAVRLSGTTIDFCATCAEKTVAAVATTFTMPAVPQPVQVAYQLDGQDKTVNLPPGAVVTGTANMPTAPGQPARSAVLFTLNGRPQQLPLPPGATLVTPIPAATAAAS